MIAREGKGNRPSWLLGAAVAALAAGTADAALVTLSNVVTNTTNSTQSYEFSRSVKVSEAIGLVAMRGSMSVIVSDFNGDGASFASDSGNLFSGWVNGSRLKSFAPVNNVVGFQVSSTPWGMGFYNADFGNPTAELTSQSLAINDTIELRFNFRLSAGDQATFTGTWDLLSAGAVPGPGAFAATLLAPWIGLHRRRRTENRN